MPELDRRQLLVSGLAGIGSLIVLGSLPRGLAAAEAGPDAAPPAPAGLAFVQLSDLHVGFNGAKINPEADGMLARAVAAVNALDPQPDFVIATGDLSHTVDDPHEREARLIRVRDQLAKLRTPTRFCMPGEHDAALDQGEVYRRIFGPSHYSFDRQGVHCIALDNVSDPKTALGAEQLAWLKTDLAAVPAGRRIVVFTHRPLFPLAKEWDWFTADGQAAIDLLLPFPDVTVFYGHIHQEHHFATGHIEHHAVRSLMFPLSPPGAAKKASLPWDPAAPFRGLGWREVVACGDGRGWTRREFPIVGG